MPTKCLAPNDNDHSIPTHDKSPQGGRKGARIENYIFIRHQQARPPSLTQGSTALRPFYFFLNAQGGDGWGKCRLEKNELKSV